MPGPLDPALDGLVAAYPLQVCVVSGEALGDHGKPFEYQHNGRLVRMCCDSCIEQFEETPAKYLAMIDKASADAEFNP